MPLSVPRPWRVASSETYGGHTTTSTSFDPKRRICVAYSRAWCAPLYIFQFPAISTSPILVVRRCAAGSRDTLVASRACGRLGAAVSHAGRVASGVVAGSPGSRGVRVEPVRKLAGPHARRGDGRHAPGDDRPGRAERRRPDARRSGRALVRGRDGRRVGPVDLAAVRGWRDPALPRGRATRLE